MFDVCELKKYTVNSLFISSFLLLLRVVSTGSMTSCLGTVAGTIVLCVRTEMPLGKSKYRCVLSTPHLNQRVLDSLGKALHPIPAVWMLRCPVGKGAAPWASPQRLWALVPMEHSLLQSQKMKSSCLSTVGMPFL